MADEIGQGQKAPWYLWAIGVIALLWNAFGIFLWAGTTFSPDTFLANMSAEHRAYIDSLPIWSTLSWALGVIGGTAGAILLLLRHRWAVSLFGLSLLGALVNTITQWVGPPPGGLDLVLPSCIILFAAFLFWFARLMQRRGVL